MKKYQLFIYLIIFWGCSCGKKNDTNSLPASSSEAKYNEDFVGEISEELIDIYNNSIVIDVITDGNVFLRAVNASPTDAKLLLAGVVVKLPSKTKQKIPIIKEKSTKLDVWILKNGTWILKSSHFVVSNNFYLRIDV